MPAFDWQDPFRLTDQLTEEERLVRDTAHAYAQEKLLPRVTSAYLDERFDREIMTEMGELGLLGATIEPEYGGAGLGYVDSFNLQGQFISRVASQGTLNAPWGLAIAPSSFGALAGSLLVGHFGDGRINAYNLVTNAFLGQITDGSGAPLAIDGLWAIAPGNNGNAGSSSLLYFTAGPDGETHGLFGVLTPVPEPATAWLWAAGLALGWVARRRRMPASAR